MLMYGLQNKNESLSILTLKNLMNWDVVLLPTL